MTSHSPAPRTLLEQRLKKKVPDASSGKQTIPRRTNDDTAPLSFAQQRLWFLNQLEPDSPAYNHPNAIRLDGVLNVEALRKTLDAIVARHEVLRSTISLEDGNPVQVIAEAPSVELQLIDLREMPDGEHEAEIQRLVVVKTQEPFNLSQDLMLRAFLARLSEKEHVLLLVMHHLVSDGWSSGILFREIATLYKALSAGSPSPLPELPIQYADFAAWQRKWLQGEELERQLSYWKQQLGGNLPVLELPIDRPRPAVQTYRGARQSIALSRSLTETLKDLSRRERVTLFMTLMAAYQTLLYRYTGQEDILGYCQVEWDSGKIVG